jgi:alkylation response protein AidB-like acyl-CoA dehydrogenase
MNAGPDTDGALAKELRYFEIVTPGGHQMWLRFCPQPIREDPLLEALDRCLQEPDTRRELEDCDARARYPLSIVERLGDLGLSQLFCQIGPVAPKATAYHLSALNFLTARLSASLAISVGVNSLALLSAYRRASPEQLTKILGLVRKGAFSALALTELEHGSNLIPIKSYAVSGTLSRTGKFVRLSDSNDATHYLLHAHKQLINGGSQHQIIFILVRTAPIEQAGKGPRERHTHSLFWIERDPIVAHGTRWHTLPAPAADISEVHLENVLVDAGHRIGQEGDGLGLIQETLAMSRGGVAALAVGTLSRARELALAYAVRRKVYGRKMGELGGIAGHLVRLDALERAATAVSLRAAAWVNACGAQAAPYTAVAKLMSCWFAEEGVAEGRNVLGARALLRQLPYAQLISDVLLFGVFDGTSHLMLDELQMYLSTETRRWLLNKAVQIDTVTVMRLVYAIQPRSFVGASEPNTEVRPFDTVAHAQNIARIPGNISLKAVAELAEALLLTVAEAKRQGKWGYDQGLRFALAEVYALIEVVLSLVELMDPIRRNSFVAYQTAMQLADEVGYYHALALLGSRACTKLLHFAGTAGHQRAVITDIQARFVESQDEMRRALAELLLKDCA